MPQHPPAELRLRAQRPLTPRSAGLPRGPLTVHHVPMQRFVFDLSITADEWMAYYRGAARHVVATARDGRRVKFPARHLQRFVSREGVRGTFEMLLDDNHDMVGFERVGPR